VADQQRFTRMMQDSANKMVDSLDA
jgi:hypothetical protein